jgi:hypothetical protein
VTIFFSAASISSLFCFISMICHIVQHDFCAVNCFCCAADDLCALRSSPTIPYHRHHRHHHHHHHHHPPPPPQPPYADGIWRSCSMWPPTRVATTPPLQSWWHFGRLLLRYMSHTHTDTTDTTTSPTTHASYTRTPPHQMTTSITHTVYTRAHMHHLMSPFCLCLSTISPELSVLRSIFRACCSTCLPVCLSVCLSVSLSVCLSVCLAVSLSLSTVWLAGCLSFCVAVFFYLESSEMSSSHHAHLWSWFLLTFFRVFFASCRKRSSAICWPLPLAATAYLLEALRPWR